MFSDCLRAEFAHAGIDVSTICPGIVHTNFVATTHFRPTFIPDMLLLGPFLRCESAPGRVSAPTTVLTVRI